MLGKAIQHSESISDKETQVNATVQCEVKKPKVYTAKGLNWILKLL